MIIPGYLSSSSGNEELVEAFSCAVAIFPPKTFYSVAESFRAAKEPDCILNSRLENPDPFTPLKEIKKLAADVLAELTQAVNSRAETRKLTEGRSKVVPGGHYTGTRRQTTFGHKPSAVTKAASSSYLSYRSCSGTKNGVLTAVRAKRVRITAARLLNKIVNDPVPNNLKDVVEGHRNSL